MRQNNFEPTGKKDSKVDRKQKPKGFKLSEVLSIFGMVLLLVFLQALAVLSVILIVLGLYLGFSDGWPPGAIFMTSTGGLLILGQIIFKKRPKNR